jgi:hypothetical protein
MSDAALGELPAGQEAELRAHASRCEGCRAALAAERALVAAVDRSVEALISGELPLAFAARLRARVAAESAPRGWPGFAWSAIAAGALAAAAVLGAVLLRSSPREERLPMNVANSTRSAAPAEPALQEPVRAAGRASGAGRGDVGAAQRRSEPPPLRFEVLVPRGQLDAALELSDAVSAGRVDGEHLAALAQAAAKPLELKAIEIAPLEAPRLEERSPAASPDGAARF